MVAHLPAAGRAPGSILDTGAEDAAECVGGIREQNDALFSVFLLVLYRVRIREGMDRSFLVLFSLHPDCLDKGPDTDPERSLDLTLVEL